MKFSATIHSVILFALIWAAQVVKGAEASRPSMRISEFAYDTMAGFSEKQLEFQAEDLKKYVQERRIKKEMTNPLIDELVTAYNKPGNSVVVPLQVYFEAFGAAYFILHGIHLEELSDQELEELSPIFLMKDLDKLEKAMAATESDPNFKAEVAQIQKDVDESNEGDRKYVKARFGANLTVHPYLKSAPAVQE